MLRHRPSVYSLASKHIIPEEVLEDEQDKVGEDEEKPQFIRRSSGVAEELRATAGMVNLRRRDRSFFRGQHRRKQSAQAELEKLFSSPSRPSSLEEVERWRDTRRSSLTDIEAVQHSLRDFIGVRADTATRSGEQNEETIMAAAAGITAIMADEVRPPTPILVTSGIWDPDIPLLC